MKRLVTEMFLAQNFSPKPGITPGTGLMSNIRAMDCDQIKDRYFVDILGITNIGHRCPSQDEIVNAQTPQLGNFIGLGFFHYFWRGLHQLADGRVLVTTYQDGTGIYKVENDALSWFQNDNRNYWTDICQLNNSDVLVTSYGKIYKKINDLGDFAEFISLSHNWSTICAASTGGAIACVYGGDVYLISGSGSYVALGETPRNWSGICQLNNGDVAACVDGGDIYYSIGGTGIYGGIGGTSRNWSGICQLNNGDVLACVFGGDIYRSVDGGPFLPLGQTSRNWSGICALTNGGAMATVSNGDIYKAIIE